MDLTLTNIFIALSFRLDNANNVQELWCESAKEVLSLLELKNGKKNALPIPQDQMAMGVQVAAPAQMPWSAALPKELPGRILPGDGKSKRILRSFLPTPLKTP